MFIKRLFHSSNGLTASGEIVIDTREDDPPDYHAPANSPQGFAKRTGIKFNNTSLLIRAFTHRSYLNENTKALEDNERLEFLGDAVLNFLVGAWLYNHYPELAEGRLTSLRSALVRNDQLAEYARQLEMGKAILLGRGEEDAKGRERTILLGSVFEAFTGALYLDSGLESVQRFLEPLLEPAAQKIVKHRHDLDPKSQLQELTQSKGMGTPYYRTVDTQGPLHQPVYTVEVLVGEQVIGMGSGTNKQGATKNAAENALNKIEEQDGWQV
ncbi:MAG: ribonuclease III [Chloroflexota bacterium]